MNLKLCDTSLTPKVLSQYQEDHGFKPVDELVFWYRMFAPTGRLDGTTVLPVGLH